MNRLFRTTLTLTFAALVAACSTGVTLDEKGAPIESRAEGAGGASAQMGGADASGTAGRSASQSELQQDPFNDPNNPLSRRSIYFDFDSFQVREEYRVTVEAHARFLLTNPQRRIIIQGNTDERGSREYNLALGQKRAEAVRRALATLGVTEQQMEAVSFGEERPKAPGTDEASFAENRRADIVYQ